MPIYQVWCDHGEVESPVIGVESDGNEDDDLMDEMVADIGREFEVRSGEQGQPPELQNFYRLLATADEKVHDGTDVTVLQVVTHLMSMKSKCSFSNQCYNDIVKLIIHLIPMMHNMPKDLYQSKKIVSDLDMNYEKIDVCKKNYMLFWKEHKDDIECMHCGRSIYVKVRNEDGVSVIIKVATKQFCYIRITLRLK
jgi:DNA-directed RNA polymerase subunit RPC12/RpoP